MKKKEAQARTRKRDVALGEAENLFLETLRAGHPEWIDPETGECSRCVTYEHELASGRTEETDPEGLS